MHDAETIAVIIWLIRKSRNEQLFEGTERGAKHICNYGQVLLQDFKALQDKKEASISYQNPCHPDSKWKPPLQDYLKLNVDASFSNGDTGIGVIVRDHIGEIQAVLIENFPHCFDAEHAEIMAFMKALEFAGDFAITYFELEGDALGVIIKINSAKADLSMLMASET